MNKLLLCLFVSIGAFAQTQIGLPINGEAAGDNSGNSISLSSDGNIIAIGDYGSDSNGSNSGQARIHQNISGVWTQIGNDINGEAAGDGFGISISLSSNGSIVAVGALYNDGNGIDSGHVRVYQNISGVWTQIGNDINGEAAGDNFGIHVELSADGSIVAISATKNDGNGLNSGHVRIFQNLSGNWTQIGNDINGEAGDESGKLSLSSDGTIIAIGSSLNNSVTTYAGKVRVFQNISGNWIQIGNDINGESLVDLFGRYLSLSANGNIVAVSAPGRDGSAPDSGQVRVFQNISGVWTQIGDRINGEAELDLAGFGLEINSTGDVLAIGAMQNDSNGADSGNVRIFKYISGNWIQIGSSIVGQVAGDTFGRSISFSSDASVMAASSIFNDSAGTDSGHVRVYDLTAILASDAVVQSNFLIYPNPSNGIINIALENNLQLEKVSVYNQLGQLVKKTETNVISTMELAQGTYFVEVVTNQGKATKKIIVE